MKKLFKHGGKAYLIKRELLHFKAMNPDGTVDIAKIQVYRDFVNADHVLKNATHFLFCETIEDVEFEEIVEVMEDVPEPTQTPTPEESDEEKESFTPIHSELVVKKPKTPKTKSTSKKKKKKK